MSTGRGSPVRQPAMRCETPRFIVVPSREEPVALRLRAQVLSARMLGPETLSGETALLAALRGGDEDAFSALVDAYGAAMHRVALTFVRSSAVADEVVQEAWLGALRGLDRFEGRSALKTWLLRIVANIARTHAVREAPRQTKRKDQQARQDLARVDRKSVV